MVHSYVFLDSYNTYSTARPHSWPCVRTLWATWWFSYQFVYNSISIYQSNNLHVCIEQTIDRYIYLHVLRCLACNDRILPLSGGLAFECASASEFDVLFAPARHFQFHLVNVSIFQLKYEYGAWSEYACYSHCYVTWCPLTTWLSPHNARRQGTLRPWCITPPLWYQRV